LTPFFRVSYYLMPVDGKSLFSCGFLLLTIPLLLPFFFENLFPQGRVLPPLILGLPLIFDPLFFLTPAWDGPLRSLFSDCLSSFVGNPHASLSHLAVFVFFLKVTFPEILGHQAPASFFFFSLLVCCPNYVFFYHFGLQGRSCLAFSLYFLIHLPGFSWSGPKNWRK